MWQRLRTWMRRDAVADEIREELEFHLAMRTDELVRQGLSRPDAERHARRRFGNVARLRDEGYDIRGAGLWDPVLQDIRHSLRLWRRRPASAMAVVGTLALGSALVATLAAILQASWFAPLPLAAADRLVTVQISVSPPGSDGQTFQLNPSYRDLERLRQFPDVVTAVGGRLGLEERPVVDLAEPERVLGNAATPGYFEALGAVPVAGRTFTPDDARPGAATVVILGHSYWQQRFNGDRSVVGTSTRVDGQVATIVGIAPAAFHRAVHVWRPYGPTGSEAEFPGGGMDVVATLAPGMTPSRAMGALASAVAAWPTHADLGRTTNVHLGLVYDDVVEVNARAVQLTVASVALLVILVMVNVAGLIYVQGVRRRDELAVRAALGAGRGRLMRQQFTEATVLGVFAALCGVLLAALSLDAVLAVLPIADTPHATPTIDAGVFGATLLCGLVTAWLVALLPAWHLSNADLPTWMAGRLADRTRRWFPRPGQWVSAVQVAIAAMLLTAGALLTATVSRLLDVDLGFDPDAFHVLEVAPIASDPAAWQTFYPALVARVAEHPAVEAVAATDWVPLSQRAGVVMAADTSSDWNLWLIGTTADYASAMGLRFREGRWFTEAEIGTPVVVLTASAAQAVFGTNAALGRSVDVGGPPTQPRLHTVVGVVDDIRGWGPRSKPDTTAFVPLDPGPFQAPALVIRTRPGMAVPVADLKAMATGLGTRVVFERVRPGTALLDSTIEAPRQRSALLGFLALAGLGFALVGIAGVSMESVVRRTKEIGLRIACGATPMQVVGVVARDALWPAVVGLTLGLGSAAYGTRLLVPFLFEVPPGDPRVFALVGASTLAVVLLAAWLPALKAASLDVARALKDGLARQ